MIHRPIRVLQVVPSLNRAAGVSRFVYNMTRNSDESRVHYDFLHHAQNDGVPHHVKRFDEELEDSGHKVYKVDFAGHDFPRFIRETKAVFEEVGASYDIVHCHMPNSAFCVLREAKRVGVEHRVLHSHLNSSSDNFFHRVRNVPLNAIGKRYTTDRLACSEEAGRYLFGSFSFRVINNGIQIEDYRYDQGASARLRAEFGIGSHEPVVGCVGRFVKQKNLGFAIEVFESLLKKVPDARLVILGDGVARQELVAKAEDLHIRDSLILPGIREDANSFYSMFDVFFMPSLYEGLPVSALEAQAAGLPCVYSDGVPRETDVSGTGCFVTLESSRNEWSSALIEAISRGRCSDNVNVLREKGYSASANAELLIGYYEMLLGLGGGDVCC